jgi:prolyl-tRNA synthetase
MRLSRMLVPTLRDAPGGVRSNILGLLVRGGYLRALDDGQMAFLPLGARLLRRLESVAEEEVCAAGFLEVQFPQPPDEGSAFGPNRVEQLAARGSDLARRALRSYRNVPQRWFSWAHGTEADPHLKTASALLAQWSLRAAGDAADRSDRPTSPLGPGQAALREALARLGLQVTQVAATPLAAEGTTQRTQLSALDVNDPDGDLDVLWCTSCGARALGDVATGNPAPPASLGIDSQAPSATIFPTPGVRTIRDLASPPFGVRPDRQLKSLVFRAGEGLVLAVVRGDDELSLAKLGYRLEARPLRAAAPEEIRQLLGALPGSLGAVGTEGRLPVLADRSLRGLVGMVTGANKDDYHLRGVNVDRDLVHAAFVDLRKAVPGDSCAVCGGRLQASRSLAVAWQSRWTEHPSGGSPGSVLGPDGNESPLELFTSELALHRILVHVASQAADERGFCWPAAISPFDATILGLGPRDPQIDRACEALEASIAEAGLAALYDDRDERAGVKFADADLAGSPVRLGVGPRGLASSAAEWKARAGGDVQLVPLGEVARRLSAFMDREAQIPRARSDDRSTRT